MTYTIHTSTSYGGLLVILWPSDPALIPLDYFGGHIIQLWKGRLEPSPKTHIIHGTGRFIPTSAIQMFPNATLTFIKWDPFLGGIELYTKNLWQFWGISHDFPYKNALFGVGNYIMTPIEPSPKRVTENSQGSFAPERREAIWSRFSWRKSAPFRSLNPPVN